MDHFRSLAPSLERTGTAFRRLLPNFGGSNASCWRLDAGVVRSMADYGAPVQMGWRVDYPAGWSFVRGSWTFGVSEDTARSPGRRRASLMDCHRGVWRRSGWRDATASFSSDCRRSLPDAVVMGRSCFGFGGTKRPDVPTVWTTRRTRFSIRWRCASLGKTTAVFSWRRSATATSCARPWSGAWCGEA